MKKFPLAAFAILTMVAIASPAAALTTWTDVTLENNFDNGETTKWPDGYRGCAGNGWDGGWTDFRTTNSGTAEATVVDTNPLNGSGNYLSVTIKNKYGDSKDYRAGFARDYLSAGCLDSTADFTVQYSIRIDGDDFIQDEGEGNDRVFFRIGKENYPAAQPEDCIDIYMRGDGTWRLMNGSSTQTATGFGVNVGDVYDVALTVHVADALYDITINNTTAATSYTASGLAWRSTHEGIQPYIGFSAYEITDYQTYGYSIDSLQVHQNRTITIGGMNEVVAHFNEGETTDFVDGYAGQAGDGWNNAWQTKKERCTLDVAVRSEADNPLHTGTGNYVEMVAHDFVPGTYEYGVAGVTRDYARMNEDGIDWTKNHTVKFSVRIDDDLSTFTENYDRYQIFDQSYVRGGIDGCSTWGASVEGDGSGFWSFIDGSGTVDSTIALVSGAVYDFTIELDTTARTYHVTLTDGTSTFTDTFDWRSNLDYVGGVLHFIARGNAAEDVRAWSIDEIIISDIVSIPGDTNGDNIVNDADATVVASHWGQTGLTGGASDGDFNGDGTVDAADASIMAAQWGDHNESEGSTVPEPCSIILMGLGVLMLAVVRRRGH